MNLSSFILKVYIYSKVNPSHTYAVAETCNDSLTVIDEKGVTNKNTTTATIAETAQFDLDLAVFSVPKAIRVGGKHGLKPIEIKLVVKNGEMVNFQTRPTTLNGMQNRLYRILTKSVTS